MAMIQLDQNEQPFVIEEIEINNNIINDNNTQYGPIELSILERVENGLNEDYDIDHSQSYDEGQNKEQVKYKNGKEIIFVKGWIDTKSIYQRYLFGFICKIIIGLSIIYSLQYYKQNFLPIAGTLVLISLVYILKNLYSIILYRKSQFNVLVVFWVDLQFSISYFVYFLGYVLLFSHHINAQYLLLFTLPHLLLTVPLFLVKSEDNFYLAQKKFAIAETLQLALVSYKVSQISLLNWNYTMLFFMAASIYITVLGMLLTIVLSCSLFGFLYRNLQQWKIKGLIWLTWYYLQNGMIYIYLIKGVIQFYNEDDVFNHVIIQDYSTFQSDTYDILLATAYLMINFNFINLTLHVIWKKEILANLKHIIYKNETRQEVFLKQLSSDFVFSLTQISDFYFKRDNKKQTQETTTIQKIETCAICYEESPNIFFEPCNHGATCKDCFVNTMKHSKKQQVSCPVCKQDVKKVYVMEYDDETQNYLVKGEIKFKKQFKQNLLLYFLKNFQIKFLKYKKIINKKEYRNFVFYYTKVINNLFKLVQINQKNIIHKTNNKQIKKAMIILYHCPFPIEFIISSN